MCHFYTKFIQIKTFWLSQIIIFFPACRPNTYVWSKPLLNFISTNKRIVNIRKIVNAATLNHLFERISGS